MCIEQQGARCCRRIGLQVSFVAESLSYFGWEKFRPINCHCCQTVLELCRFNFISMCGQFYNGVGVLCVSCYEFTVGLRLHLSTHCGSAELHVASRQQTKFCDSVTYFHCHLKISLRTLFNIYSTFYIIWNFPVIWFTPCNFYRWPAAFIKVIHTYKITALLFMSLMLLVTLRYVYAQIRLSSIVMGSSTSRSGFKSMPFIIINIIF